MNYLPHRAIEYNVEKDEYKTVAYAPHATGYNYNRFIFYSSSDNILADDFDKEFDHTHVFSAKEIENGDYKFEMIYTSPDHREWFARPPFVGENWVVIQMKHRDTNELKVLYSKVDEWSWIEYKGDSKLHEGNIVGDKLSYMNYNREVYVCDLSKSPVEKSDCRRIDRPEEVVFSPRLDEENTDLLYYQDSGKSYITRVDLKEEIPVYSELPTQASEEKTTGYDPMQIKGNMIHYNESFMNGSRLDYKACFYNINKKKSYCPHTVIRESLGRYDMGFNSWDGKYQLWKTPSGTFSGLRDMECYCKEEGVCPFE